MERQLQHRTMLHYAIEACWKRHSLGAIIDLLFKGSRSSCKLVTVFAIGHVYVDLEGISIKGVYRLWLAGIGVVMRSLMIGQRLRVHSHVA